MYNSWMFQGASSQNVIIVTQNEAAHATLHKMLIQYKI